MKLISEQWSDEVDYLIEEDPKTGKKHMFSFKVSCYKLM